MKNLLNWISKNRFPYKPLITIEISRSRLLHNIYQFHKIAPKGRIIPTLKSNAYGHGIYEVASILENERKTNLDFYYSIPLFAVDSYFEAISLRTKKIKTPLIIIGYTRPEDILISKLKNLSFFITSIDSLQAIQKTNYDIKIHLKIDTGMHRQGILPAEIDRAIDIIKSNNKIILEGISSHLADADSIDSEFTNDQIEAWNKIVKKFTQTFDQIKYIHLSNTYGHKYNDKISANISRLGIGLYGLADNINDNIALLPVLQMKTIITSMKQISKGESVGYNHSFTATKNMKIATIPVGYYEGLDRRLSNIGYIQVGSEKKSCQLVGKISMNISSIDISDISNPKINEEVIVISNDKNDKNSIYNIARLTNTIEYELAVHIPQHLKRSVVE